MKNIKFSFGVVLAFALVFLSSCEKEKTTANLSTITYYPVITLNGDQWNEIAVGGSFTDPGVVAKEGETEISVTTEGTVDVNTPGVYTISYTAVNKDGYSSTDYRYVGVIDPAVAGQDMSGAYKRNAGAQGIATVSKISGNLFYSNNVGGVAVPNPSIGVFFYYYAPGKIDVPFQNTPGNAFECTNESVELGVNFKWVVINSGYGAALRTFIKQ
ncbi:MAG: DUF5011 domain-containing protein [Sphingobacteriales bacterium]|jgi:hypothetical protein|nr:DUF5011 domain-containing protein [Sphingobacteriales bacterium]MBP9141557.1 DUF5011 domain-containing protein [Chitinophagales bacterium]MDA0199924.1 DUF5011 domain-containing protein [Bacteroidota bacterium]MBK6889804.1 DUF5011 domain-containing protein [Sphingobacteriales bacterium]MBK7527678.1 DUF5011 domain-containing protein [Sphingobacteriales bacterium]